ncbi:MAG: RidA family protein, partial [Dermatophilaceae bacterium]
MSVVEDRLSALGLTVPEVVPPVASYVPVVRDGNLVFTSGQLPMSGGALAATGKVGAGVSAEDAKGYAATCALNAIAAIKSVVDL